MGTSYTNNIWRDVTGNGHDAVTLNNIGLNFNLTLSGYRIIAGTTSSAIQFEPDLSPQHTVINLCRILQTTNYNGLFGFYYGYTGVAFEEGWMTNVGNANVNEDWLLSAQTPDLYRGNGVDYTANPGYPITGKLGINIGFISEESSDWACAEIIIINQILTKKHKQNMNMYRLTNISKGKIVFCVDIIFNAFNFI